MGCRECQDARDGDGKSLGIGSGKCVWREADLIARLYSVTNYLGGCLRGERKRAGAASGREGGRACASLCWMYVLADKDRAGWCLPARESCFVSCRWCSGEEAGSDRREVLAGCSSKQVNEGAGAGAGEVARYAAVKVNLGGSGVGVQGQALLLLPLPSLSSASVQEAVVYLGRKA